jgi:hypothetical protein
MLTASEGRLLPGHEQCGKTSGAVGAAIIDGVSNAC